MRNIILLSLIAFFSSPLERTGEAFSQSQFQRTIGGAGADAAYSIIQTTDGGYALAGVTNSFGAGNYDFYITKLDASGTLQWSKTIGGPNYDYAYSIIQTTDGGYAVAAVTQSFGAGLGDMYIVKLNASGTLQWSKTVGGIGNDYTRYAYCIIQATDGGYAVAGNTTSWGPGLPMYIVKLDASGTLQWSKTVDVSGGFENQANSIIQTTDGGYAVAGSTAAFGPASGDMCIVKLGASGTLQWSRIVGGSGTTRDSANSIVQTTDGGYALAGVTNSFGAGGFDFFITKLDASGTLQWSKTVGGTGDESAYSIIQTTDGGYAVAGQTSSFGAGGFDMYIVKLDANGNTCANSTSPSSSTATGATLGNPTSTVTSPTPTVTTPTPPISSGGTLTPICIVGIQPISNEIPGSYKLYQNYPNPFNPVTKIRFDIPAPLSSLEEAKQISLIIYDVLGREVVTLFSSSWGRLGGASYEIQWEASDYPSGIYFYSLLAGDYKETKKMVLLR